MRSEKKVDAQLVVSALAVVLGGVGFAAGLYQYSRAQTWKRYEFVAKEIKEFEARSQVQLALTMLDWNDRYYDLFPEREPVEERTVRVKDSDIAEALVNHLRNPEVRFTDTVRFSETQTRLRDIFDELLDSLERFEHFIRSGLVKKNDFRPYLEYWLEVMGNRSSGRKPQTFYDALWDYIDGYGWTEVQDLFKRFGYNIRPSRTVQPG